MGDPRAFLSVPRKKEDERSREERVRDSHEVSIALGAESVGAQASRCMDCGIPFCHQGCPLGNLIPEWNDLVYRGDHDEALRRLHETNNFPEITGRVCPAPCEASCVLSLENSPVAIKAVERMLGDRAIETLRAERHMPSEPRRAPLHGEKKVAIVGSGPAGLAAAQELARAGHAVTVFERDDRIGGLLRYGIPDFKLDKALIDERVAQLRAERVVFETGVDVGVGVTGGALLKEFDRIVLAGGARKARTLDLPGADVAGVYLAMDFLTQENRRVAGDPVDASKLSAKGKNVIVLGGGDTGSDCVGTSHRHGAKSILQLELMPSPPLVRAPENPWPEWPLVMRSSSSHDEGGTREWAVATRGVLGNASGHVTALEAVRVELVSGKLRDLEGSRFSMECDLLLLAMGFVGPEPGGILSELGVAMDGRGNVVTRATGETSVPRVFATGDMSRGQSLVVWAIADGRRVARGVVASFSKDS